ncbi:MAG: quinone-dependent dihydroorotate dehydrogenase [Dinghuibacter sp.]|nr:quinone-dependent dihydroorotate dehydrogenase [Dinghuibacter sp.]
MYRLLRTLFFLLPAETAHYAAMNGLKMMCTIPLFRKWISRYFRVPAITGVPPNPLLPECRNPIGLAAGFDKNARYLRELECLGFGFVEIGTVTPQPQPGNDKPRLFRLVKDKALINRMGFNNDGMEAVAARLKKWRQQHPLTGPRMLIGANIGKNKITPNEEAWRDYELCFTAFYDVADYFVVNVSSPNTPGLRELQEKDSLKNILTRLQQIAAQKAGEPKPILLKIAPDLTPEQINDIAQLALEIRLNGLVVANTTISREGLLTPAATIEAIGAGGLSGLPVQERATALIRQLHQATGAQIPIIGSGGIFTGAHAKDKLDAGATLVQVWTGFIYEGPGIVQKIARELDNLS